MIGSINKITLDLSTTDVKIKDKDKSLILLRTLPPYNHIITTLFCGNDTISIEEVKSGLLSNDLRKMVLGCEYQDESLIARGRHKEKGSGGGRKNRSRPKKKVECYCCHKFGHMKETIQNS